MLLSFTTDDLSVNIILAYSFTSIVFGVSTIVFDATIDHVVGSIIVSFITLTSTTIDTYVLLTTHIQFDQ